MSAVLSIRSVMKKFDGKRVLSNVTLSAGRGEAVGLIGPNGAGKTTLLRIAMGLVRADAGLVWLEGEPVLSALRRVRTAYFAGEATLPPAVRVRAWRNLFHDTEARSDNRPIRLLSRGTRQLIALRTLFSLSSLRLIVLDEPWEGLDPSASLWLGEALRARRDAGATILVSSHRLHDLAAVCDRYVFLDRGFATGVAPEAVARHGAAAGDALFGVFDAVSRRAR